MTLHIAGRRTIKDWEPIFAVEILDPDGFDRSDPHLWTRKYSYEEFKKAMPLCTMRRVEPGSIYRREPLDV